MRPRGAQPQPPATNGPHEGLTEPIESNSVAKKPSKAPKERINITYRSAIRPNETIELPFKMLVLADITGEEDERPFEERPPIRVDKDNFNDVLKETKVKLAVNVPNRLEEGDDAGEFGANLKFQSLKDFTPGGVAKQVPELAKLLELREALSALKSPLGNRREFRKQIEDILKDKDARARLMAELGLGEEG